VLLFLNLVLLLWTSLLPFPTGLVARYLGAGGPNASVAEALYSLNLTLAATAFSLVWFRAVHGNRLVDAQLTPRQQWATLARFSMGTLVYALTIAVAFAAPAVALAIQFLLALYYLFEQVRPTGADAVTVAD
jgi:TMEM175 potassium channel family protein